jgi:hypothetical protein
MGNRIVAILFALAFLAGVCSDLHAQSKSVSKASKIYTRYVKDKANGEEKKAQKRSSDPATVTREKAENEDDVNDPMQDDFEDFEAFRRNARKDFSNFRDEVNRDYAEFVKEAWASFRAQPAVPQPKEDEKPPVVINDDEKKKAPQDNPLPIKETVTPPAPEPQPKPVAPIREQPVADETQNEFAVYGTSMKVRFNDGQKFQLSGLDGNSIAKAWEMLSGSDYNNTIRDCLALRQTKHLSDWAYLNMLSAMSEACLGKTNEATLLTAFIFCQSGYQMRLAVAGDKLRMLYSSKHFIFGKPYYDIDGTDYYVFNGDEQSLNICNAQFPKEKALSLYINNAQDFDEMTSGQRTLSSVRYPDMSVRVAVNKNLVDFFNGYPTSIINHNFMTKWAIYANTPLDRSVASSLYPALKEFIVGKSEKEAVERLLNWVQTAFVYEYDDKVWGGDRAFFAEETLYYPYCDCEDRSILFSHLVRDLLGLDVILVFYPGHLATAVCFKSDVKGDYIMSDGRKFVVCDPTYIGAPLGMTMPGMNNSEATVILLNNAPSE